MSIRSNMVAYTYHHSAIPVHSFKHSGIHLPSLSYTCPFVQTWLHGLYPRLLAPVVVQKQEPHQYSNGRNSYDGSTWCCSLNGIFNSGKKGAYNQIFIYDVLCIACYDAKWVAANTVDTHQCSCSNCLTVCLFVCLCSRLKYSRNIQPTEVIHLCQTPNTYNRIQLTLRTRQRRVDAERVTPSKSNFLNRFGIAGNPIFDVKSNIDAAAAVAANIKIIRS